MTVEQLKTEALLAVENAENAQELMSQPDEDCVWFKIDDGKNFWRVRVDCVTSETEVSPW